MAQIKWPNESIFERFNIIEETYKHIGSHPTKAAILIPKDVESVIHPILVNIHGGLFAAGHSLFAPFWSPWVLDLAVEHGAVVVSPDYRLLPTANGISDICEDLRDFWTWVNEKLPQVLHRRLRGHAVDYSKILLFGSSTGGYGALQLALSHPQGIAMLALMYPVMNLKDKIFSSETIKGQPGVLSFPPDQLPSLQESLIWVVDRKRRVCTRDGFDAMFFAASLINHGVFARTLLFPRDAHRPEGCPFERIHSGTKLPTNIWITQGDMDSIVHTRQSDEFVRLITDTMPEVDVRYDLATGQDHVFDADEGNWVSFKAHAVDFLEEGWLDEKHGHKNGVPPDSAPYDAESLGC